MTCQQSWKRLQKCRAAASPWLSSHGKLFLCGSLLTLLPLDIWKVLKPQKSTQVLRIEHHFVFYMISSFPPKVFWFLCILLCCRDSIPAIRHYIPLPVHFHKSSSDQQGIYISCPSNPGLHWEEEWRIWQILWREGILKVFFPSSDDGHWQRWSFCWFVSFWGTTWTTNVQRKT